MAFVLNDTIFPNKKKIEKKNNSIHFPASNAPPRRHSLIRPSHLYIHPRRIVRHKDAACACLSSLAPAYMHAYTYIRAANSPRELALLYGNARHA